MSRPRRGQRGQPPARTYNVQRTTYGARYDFQRNLYRLYGRDEYRGAITDEALRALGDFGKIVSANFTALSGEVEKLSEAIGRGLAHEIAKNQAHNFVSQSVERARMQNAKDEAENGPPDWWGVSMQAKMDTFPEPAEEEFPTHARDGNGGWVKLVWFCDVETRRLIAMVE